MNIADIPHDKLLHAVAGGYCAGAGALIAWYFSLPPVDGAIVAALVAAVGKEAWDLFSGKGTPEAADIAATLAGAMPVVLVALA